MAIEKVTYVDGVTIIGANNLNDIQDELIRQGEQQTEDEESMEAALALKADKETTYTKTEVDTALALKADKSDTFTKAEVNSALALKADKSDTYTKTEVNEDLELKADKSDTYTKAVVDSMVQDAIAEAVKESEYSNFEMKSVSGDFIHITDGAGLIPVKDLKIGIEAVQDLHGYDAPWVGGAGVNKFGGYTVLNAYLPASGSIVAENNNRTAVLPCLPSTQYTLKIVRTAITGSDDMQVSEFSGDTEPTYNSSGTRVDAVGYNSTTNIAQLTFTTSANTKWIAVKYANINQTNADKTIETAQLEIGSSVGDFTPYSNISPISGWTGAKVNVAGKNLLAKSLTYFSNASSSISDCFFLKAGTYHFSFSSSTATSWRLGLRMLDLNGNLMSDSAYEPWIYSNWNANNNMWLDGSNNTNKEKDVTIVKDCYVRFVFALGDTTASSVFNNVQLEVGSTATSYEPYNGTTHNISLGQTVYSGKLNVTTGVLTMDKAMLDGNLFTSVENNLSGDGSSAYVSVANTDFKAPYYYMKTNCLTRSNENWNKLPAGSISVTSTTYIVVCSNVPSQTLAQFKTWFNENVQLMLELATPQTVTLTPTEVKSLLGQNNIFADSGNVDVTYRASASLVIEQLTNAIISLGGNV